MISLSLQDSPATSGLRPVNLRTDLVPLADLIEIAFADTMDSSGRAAVREMRYLSRLGPGLNVLLGMNEVAQGVGLGFVWLEDGRVVGNTSVYPANVPTGPAWIIANVAVHPDYRGRGIAGQLVQASLDMIRRRSRSRKAIAVLQVDADNAIAQHLYARLGFVAERSWTQWRRGSGARTPPPMNDPSIYITRRRANEWRAEYAMAQRLRPAAHGGIGWLRPLHPSFFHRSLFASVRDIFSMRSFERLVIRGEQDELRAVMWVESAFAASSIQLTLMVEPAFQGVYDEALINLMARRYSLRSALSIEHPTDEEVTSGVLRHYGFSPQRSLIHMRWEAD
ncbi:MAG: GNAT family N-acetyltransferase [Anaerolineae bacterium]